MLSVNLLKIPNQYPAQLSHKGFSMKIHSLPEHSMAISISNFKDAKLRWLTKLEPASLSFLQQVTERRCKDEWEIIKLNIKEYKSIFW